MKYERYMFFNKVDSLSDYLDTDRVSLGMRGGHIDERTCNRYNAEQNIQLIAMIRQENIQVSTPRGFISRPAYYCKIRCPINPMPVKGEFELPSIDALMRFLKKNGWSYRETLWAGILE